jgi:hypothetical protein
VKLRWRMRVDVLVGERIVCEPQVYVAHADGSSAETLPLSLFETFEALRLTSKAQRSRSFSKSLLSRRPAPGS